MTVELSFKKTVPNQKEISILYLLLFFEINIGLSWRNCVSGLYMQQNALLGSTVDKA